MSEALTLEIRLDDPDRTYELGDTVVGTLLVHAHEDVETRGLLAGPRFRVASTGMDSAGGPDPVEIAPGAFLRAGSREEHPFEVELPLHPPPYVGKNFSVEWGITARADLSMKRDPVAEPVPIATRVGEASRTAPYDRWAASGMEVGLDQEEAMSGFLQRFKEGSCLLKAAAGCFVPMGCFGFVVFALGVLSVVLAEPEWEMLRNGGAAMLPVLVLWWLSNRISTRKAVGKIEVTVEPQEARPGETVQCRVTLTPRSSLPIQGVRIALMARERYNVTTRGSDRKTRQTTRWETLYEDVREVAGETTLSRNEVVEWEESFPLAPAVAYSLEAPSAGLRWSIMVEVRAPLRRDLIHHAPLVVRP